MCKLNQLKLRPIHDDTNFLGKQDLWTGFMLISIFSYCCRKLREMPGDTLKLSGKVRENLGNFIQSNLWEPCDVRSVKKSGCCESSCQRYLLVQVQLHTLQLSLTSFVFYRKPSTVWQSSSSRLMKSTLYSMYFSYWLFQSTIIVCFTNACP